MVNSDIGSTDQSSRADQTPLTSLELVHALLEWLEDKGVAQIVVLDIKNESSIADYFLIGTVVNDRHARAVEEDILADFQRQTRVRPQGIEGRPADAAVGICWTTEMSSSICSRRTRGSTTPLKNDGKIRV